MIATYFAIGIAMYLLGKMIGFESGWHQGHDFGKRQAELEIVYQVVEALDGEDVRLDESDWYVDGFSVDTARLEK